MKASSANTTGNVLENDERVTENSTKSVWKEKCKLIEYSAKDVMQKKMYKRMMSVRMGWVGLGTVV